MKIWFGLKDPLANYLPGDFLLDERKTPVTTQAAMRKTCCFRPPDLDGVLRAEPPVQVGHSPGQCCPKVQN